MNAGRLRKRLIVGFVILLLANLSCQLLNGPTPTPFSDPGEASPFDWTESRPGVAEPTQPEAAPAGEEPQTEWPAFEEPSLNDLPDDAPLALEELPIRGTLTLPEGSTIDPTKMLVLTINSAYGIEPDGTFAGAILHAPGAPQLAMAVNMDQNAVLMGIFGADELGGGVLSVESTAQAFVLYDPAVLALPSEQRAQAARALHEHAQYPALIQAVADAILTDPVDPLGDAHDELYRLGAEITGGLLNQAGLLPVAFQPGGKMALPARPQGDVQSSLAVEDDSEYGPQVILVNKTMSYYRVAASRDGQPWTPPGASSLWLVRNNLYGTAHLEWPPVSYRSTYDAFIDDGALSFHFVQDRELTGIDLFFNTASTLLGVGEAGSTDKHLKLMLSLKGTFADALKDMLQTMPQTGQMSYTDAISSYTWVIGYNGGKMLLAVSEAIAKEEAANLVESGLAKRIFKFALKKLATPVSLTYGAADSAALIYSLRNAPREATVSGSQRFGIYPAVQASLTPAMISDAEANNPYSFTVQMSGFPAQIDAVNFAWDFGDGEKPAEFGTPLSGQAFSHMQEHSFSPGSHTVQVTAYTVPDNQPVALALALVNIGQGQPETEDLSEPASGGKWVRGEVEQENFTQYILDTEFCYATPSFSDTSFSEVFGCNDGGPYTPYQVEVSASWTALPETLTPGETLSFTINASVADQGSGLNFVPSTTLRVGFEQYELNENTNKTVTFTVPEGSPGDTLTIAVKAGSQAPNVAGIFPSWESRSANYTYVP